MREREGEGGWNKEKGEEERGWKEGGRGREGGGEEREDETERERGGCEGAPSLPLLSPAFPPVPVLSLSLCSTLPLPPSHPSLSLLETLNKKEVRKVARGKSYRGGKCRRKLRYPTFHLMRHCYVRFWNRPMKIMVVLGSKPVRRLVHGI